MINYCDICNLKKQVRMIHLPEEGGFEGYGCKPCRDDLATVTTVKIIKP